MNLVVRIERLCLIDIVNVTDLSMVCQVQYGQKMTALSIVPILAERIGS